MTAGEDLRVWSKLGSHLMSTSTDEVLVQGLVDSHIISYITLEAEVEQPSPGKGMCEVQGDTGVGMYLDGRYITQMYTWRN